MRKAKNFSNRLMAMLLSAAMIFAPILESMPVYAAEADAVSGNEASDEMFHEIVRQTGTVDADDVELFSALSGSLFAASASDFSNVGGWNESIYAEIAGVTAADVTEVSWSGAMSGKLTGDDKTYLVRDNGNGGVRIDIPGLKAGTYTLTVKVGGSTLTKSGIEVYAYDRSGFAHFGYDEGVGAYNNDGTLKDNAIILYVTDKNKNDVTLTCNGITVKGIGNILNSVGQANSGGTTSNGGKPNTNQGIIRKLAEAGKPLVVRFIGCVSETGLYKKGTYDASDTGLIEGLTDYASLGNGGSVKDNGHMARIQSGKDITLEGIGYDAVIDGWGFHYIAEGSAPTLGKSFEVRNLTFINTPEDAVGMEGQQVSKNTSSDLSSSVERCWVHHNVFYCPDITSPSESDKSEGDGSVDFKRGQYFTCSYNYFEGCHKTNLVGSADYSLQFNLTYHHNYWYLCKARGPLARNANIHMYNNVVEMQTDYAQNTRANSYIFSEYNLFYACKSPQAVEGGAIKSYHDSISSVIWNKGSAGTVVEDKKAYVANACQFQARKIKYDKFDVDPELSYIPGNNYKLETDFTELRKVIASQTGVQKQKPKLPEEVATSDYSVVPKGVTPTTFDSLPQNLTPGKISKSVYAFTVNAPFNLEVTYDTAKAVPGVLVNEAGENLLTGNGELVNIPAGTYMIQAENFQPGDGKKGTTVVFKDMTISSLKIEACDPDAHYHKWVLDSSKTVAATCTETGKKVYTCAADLDGGECKETKEETVAALGHSYGGWKTDKPATETEAGEKSRSCTRCGVKETAPIPAGSTGGSTGDTSGGSTAAGDYVLTFEGSQKNDSSDFFTVTGSYSNSKGSTTVNGEKYSECLKMESKTKVSFSCNDGAKLFMAFASTESGKKVIVDGKEYTTDSAGTVTVELSAGKHEITKGDTINLFYVSVENGASSEVFYTLSFEYNYDDAPDAKTVSVAENTSYASMSQLVPASFTRSDYVLDGLYTDASCTTAVTYPYTVSSNATFYADWKEGEKQEVTYSLIFNSNNGSAVATVQVPSSQIYTITQRPTRAGYTFAGWYDALEGGNVVDRIDGSALTGNITVYAHWNASEKIKNSLDVSKDFSELMNGKTEINITEKTTVGGFTIHALAGGVGTAGSENPKYYMTVKADKNNNNAMGLFTNGVRLTKTDADIAGNEDGLLKSLEFTAEGQGILTVDLALTASPEKNKQYDLVLARKSTEGSLVEAGRASLATTGKTRATKTFDVEEAGTYYLYAEGAKGVVYYNLKLTEQVYTILYQVGAGTVPAGQGSVTAREGEEIQLPECTANPGYIFKGWSMDGGKTMLNGSYTVNTDDVSEGLIVITAIYDVLTYTVKYDANGGQLPAGMEASVTAKAGDRLTLGECTPKAGKKFAGWSVGSSDKVINDFYLVNAVDANKDNVITLKAVYTDNSKPNPEKTGLQVELKNPDETYTYTGSAIK
ncbi:MAG: InlB B-repeat-containing protein, partial [Acetatifactor sp.]|nr:InlB B-repeat-containing protein [Acetatifactor sp.]